MSLTPGQIIDGKYRIVRVLGVGGMGAVYEGENTRIHRRVAIKVLHGQVADKADIVQRFEREAQAAGRIGSEHIVEVLDLGNLPGGERYMVMEFLDGEALTSRIKSRGRMTPLETAMLLRQLLEGLNAAHEAGIIHRDLKPDNVFIVRRGGQDFVKLLDFGVSKFTSSDDFSMTRTGAVMGTPYYMSPEQARGGTIDHRSDLYSVGVVAYQAVTGQVPFNAETFNELLFKIALDTPPPIETVVPGFDPAFAQLVHRAMERDAANRFQSAAEFAHALVMWSSGAQMGAAGYSQTGYSQPGYSQAGYSQPGTGQAPGNYAQATGNWARQSANTGVHGGYPSAGQSALGSSSPGYPAPNYSTGGYSAAGPSSQRGFAPPAAPSSPGLNQSSPGFQSQPGMQAPPALASQPGYPQQPGFAPPAAGSNPGQMGAQALKPAMAESQVGVSVNADSSTRAPSPKRAVGTIAIGLVLVAVIGGGIGLALFKLTGNQKTVVADGAPPSDDKPVATSTATAESTSTAAVVPSASAPPASSSAAVVSSSPTESASAAASSSAPVSTAPQPYNPPTTVVRPTSTPPTAKPTGQSGNSGRDIDGRL